MELASMWVECFNKYLKVWYIPDIDKNKYVGSFGIKKASLKTCNCNKLNV